MANSTVIYTYTLQQALADGVLVEIFKNRWGELTDGKPLVATRAVYEAYSEDELGEIWDRYRDWQREIMPTLPDEEQLFATTMNSQRVWVLEDGAAFTILFPADY